MISLHESHDIEICLLRLFSNSKIIRRTITLNDVPHTQENHLRHIHVCNGRQLFGSNHSLILLLLLVCNLKSKKKKKTLITLKFNSLEIYLRQFSFLIKIKLTYIALYIVITGITIEYWKTSNEHNHILNQSIPS